MIWKAIFALFFFSTLTLNSYSFEGYDQRIDLLVKHGIMSATEAHHKKLEIRQIPSSEIHRIENTRRAIASIESERDWTISKIKLPLISITID